jgi:competence protein ComEC
MKRKTKQIIIQGIAIIFFIILSLIIKFQPNSEEKEVTKLTGNHDIIEVHFIDVGQGDCILIETGSNAMLIDAGENNQGAAVLEYLTNQNIMKLDYVIGTHPHSDHIGGLDTIIQPLQVNKIIMPDITHSTDTFEDVLEVIEKKELTITKAVAGDQYTLGNATFQIISPNSDSYGDINNYSVGIKLTFGDTSFLFTGDAEELSEKEMLNRGFDLSSDVIKLGHHGSEYSSSSDFLDAVNPEYAVISVGIDNQYNHPHEATLQAMKDRSIKVYRTDLQGSIVFASDGNHISVNTKAYEIEGTND